MRRPKPCVAGPDHTRGDLMNPSSHSILNSSTQNDHWDTTGWFLGALGASCWFVGSAIALAWRGQLALASISLSSWMIAIGTSIWLWRVRDRIGVFSARIVLMFVLSLVMPLVWYTSWDRPIDAMPSLYWIRTITGIAASSIYPLIIICLLADKCYSFAKPSRSRDRERRITKP